MAGNEAASGQRNDSPLHLHSAYAVIGKQGDVWASQLRIPTPHPADTPGHSDLSRWGQVKVLQLRVGRSSLTRNMFYQGGLTKGHNSLERGQVDATELPWQNLQHMLPPAPNSGELP